MTTYVPLVLQSSGVPWTGQLILDGQAYKAVVSWNIYAQRWYLSLADAFGNIAWYGPLTGSPMNGAIYLAYGVFSASTLLYRTDTGNFEVNP